jgi:hypothetical protein
MNLRDEVFRVLEIAVYENGEKTFLLLPPSFVAVEINSYNSTLNKFDPAALEPYIAEWQENEGYGH